MLFFTWHGQVMRAERYCTWMVPLRRVVGSRKIIQYGCDQVVHSDCAKAFSFL